MMFAPADAHSTQLNIKGLAGNYQVKANGGPIQQVYLNGTASVITIPVAANRMTTVTLNKLSK